MNTIDGINNQTIISINKNEFNFFIKFTKRHNIKWPREQQKNNILILNRSIVGFINTPYRVIKLLPKYKEINFNHILRMHMYVNTYKKNDDNHLLDVQNDDNLNIISDFLELLKVQLNIGIFREYIHKNISTNVLKGNVNINKTFINILSYKKYPVETEVFQLSTNNIINRLIMGALKKISSSMGKYSTEALNLQNFFIDVKNPILKNGHKELKEISFNSNNNRYAKVLNYAALIIDNTSYDDVGNCSGISEFIINFDNLYEKFIDKILIEECNNPYFSTWSHKKTFAKSIIQPITYLPDILFKYKKQDPEQDYLDSAFAVLDCKNKAYSIFKNADVYQILTYAQKLHAKKAILLYPSFVKKEAIKLYLDKNCFNPCTIYAVFINIASISGKDFLKNINLFSNEILNIITN